MAQHPKIHIGTSGWSYKDWVGPFYPEGTKQSGYLGIYSGIFDTVEVDSTFYGIPRTSTVEKWFSITDDNFIFAPKVPQEITHEKRLLQCESIWEQFISTMKILKHKLGPVVLQFDYKFSFDEHFSNLKNFLSGINDDLQICIEIRNKNWHKKEFYDLLKSHNAALVLNDLYYLPRVIELTADFTYVRLLGNRKQIPDDFSHVRVNRDKDLDWWADWIEQFREKELEVYVYSNNRYQGHAPQTIRSLATRIAG